MLARRGRSAGSILTTGPTITIDQSGRAAATASISAEVDPLVDDAVEAELRARRSPPGRRARPIAARACAKCATSTAEGKGWMSRWRSRLASYRL